MDGFEHVEHEETGGRCARKIPGGWWIGIEKEVSALAVIP